MIAAFATAGVVFFGMGSTARVPAPPATMAAGPDGEATITVHVSGAVADPGLVRLFSGARIADALAAAGGATTRADLEAVNLAAPVRDGDQILVPVSSPGDESGAGSAAMPDGKVRVNRATASELEALPGVGPVLARRIVEHRETHGTFSEIEDLLDVPGIGEAKLATLRESAVVP